MRRRIAETVLNRGGHGVSRVCVDQTKRAGTILYRVYDTCDEGFTEPGAAWDEQLDSLEEAMKSMMVCAYGVLYSDSLGGEA